MPNTRSAEKRIRQTETRRASNRWRLRTMREAIRVFRDKLVHGSVTDAEKEFVTVCRVVDKTAGKGVIHKNQASRRKSRMSAALKARKAAAKK